MKFRASITHAEKTDPDLHGGSPRVTYEAHGLGFASRDRVVFTTTDQLPIGSEVVVEVTVA